MPAGTELDKDDILIFDCYYASHLLFFYLQKMGAQFCFRMKKNWWKVVERFYNSQKDSDVVTIELPQKDRAGATAPGITKTKLQCRLTRQSSTNHTSLLDEEVIIVPIGYPINPNADYR